MVVVGPSLMGRVLTVLSSTRAAEMAGGDSHEWDRNSAVRLEANLIPYIEG